jgi:hypothetical protein
MRALQTNTRTKQTASLKDSSLRLLQEGIEQNNLPEKRRRGGKGAKQYSDGIDKVQVEFFTGR